MADYKGGGLTTVHIREASKLVESVRAEVEQLKKSVLEVFFSQIFSSKPKFQGDGNRQHKLAGLCDGWGLCDTCRWGRRRSQIENSRFGYAQWTQGRVWKFSKIMRNKGFCALNQPKKSQFCVNRTRIYLYFYKLIKLRHCCTGEFMGYFGFTVVRL